MSNNKKVKTDIELIVILLDKAEPRLVETKYGRQYVKSVPVKDIENFWKIYEKEKDSLPENCSVSKYNKQWYFNKWSMCRTEQTTVEDLSELDFDDEKAELPYDFWILYRHYRKQIEAAGFVPIKINDEWFLKKY